MQSGRSTTELIPHVCAQSLIPGSNRRPSPCKGDVITNYTNETVMLSTFNLDQVNKLEWHYLNQPLFKIYSIGIKHSYVRPKK